MLFKSEKISNLLSKKKNIAAVYVIVIIGVILLCAGSFIKPAEKVQPGVKSAQNAELEGDMEKILSQIRGVGRVSVLVTYKSSSASVLAKDVSENISENTDGRDVSREEKNVLTGSGSSQAPYVLKEEMPGVLGVVVVADGGGDSGIKREITQAVKALCGISANNIKVFEKK